MQQRIKLLTEKGEPQGYKERLYSGQYFSLAHYTFYIMAGNPNEALKGVTDRAIQAGENLDGMVNVITLRPEPLGMENFLLMLIIFARGYILGHRKI